MPARTFISAEGNCETRDDGKERQTAAAFAPELACSATVIEGDDMITPSSSSTVSGEARAMTSEGSWTIESARAVREE